MQGNRLYVNAQQRLDFNNDLGICAFPQGRLEEGLGRQSDGRLFIGYSKIRGGYRVLLGDTVVTCTCVIR